MSVAMNLDWSLGDRIKKARTHAGLEQNDLGRAVGVSRQLISKWERGASEPSAMQAVDIARVCNVDVLWLLGLAPTTTCFSAPPLSLVAASPGQMTLPFGERPRLVTVTARNG